MMTRRRDWSIAEWRDFAARYLVCRVEIDSVGNAFRGTRGLTAPVIDAWLRARDKVQALAVALDHLIVDQQPGLISEVHAMVHGTYKPFVGSCPRHPEPLTREEWAALGDRLKSLRHELGRLGIEIQATRGAGVGLSDKFIKAADMARLRDKLSGLAARQHPEWEEAWTMFYGPELNRAI